MRPDALQRRLILGIVLAATLTFAVITADLVVGGRRDPPALRAAATLLDGAWRFHTGDDAHWADPDSDDSGWESIDLTAAPGSHDGDVGLPDYVGGWMAHGHPGYHGYAWYRRSVTVPATSAAWDILGPTLVDHGYELYWNGALLGGSGRLDPAPRFVGTRPTKYALPADAAGSRGVLAIRVYMLPGSGASGDGGGLHSAPILAPQPVSDELHRVQWQRTIAGYVVDAVEPACMLAVIVLALFIRSRSTRPGFLVFACIALALMGARRLNNAIVAWTDLQSLTTYGWLASWMWVPAVTAWTLAWNRWCLPRWRSIDVLALVSGVAGIAGAAIPAAVATRLCRFGSIALFVAIGARIARHGSARALALVTLASIVASYFGAELLDPLGVPGIWFPFGIGVSRTQFIYAAAIPLVACLMVRTLSSDAPHR
jgi:hypothetical protein